MNQTGGAYTLHWIGTATQTTIPTGSIYFTYDKYGYSYNDYISGNGGNDTINGGAGNDTASYNGNKADYTITNNNGIWTVADTRAGSPNGTDTLTGIELISFIDNFLDLTIRFYPTSSSYSGSSNSINGTGFDDQIDADALAVANPYKGSSSTSVYFGSQSVYTLGVNEFSMIGTVRFNDQELTNLTNLGLELWHGTEKVETNFTVNASDITNQTGGAYTVHWVGTATQTTIPTGSIQFTYDKDGYSYNDYIYGNGGNDTISGGAGNDTASYNGNRADYTITNNNGVWTVADTRTGEPDGTDTLTGIEHISFNDNFLDLTIRFYPTSSSSYPWSSNSINGSGLDDAIDADALAVANPYKGSSSTSVYFGSQSVYTLGVNEFSMIGTVTFTTQKLANLTNLGLELWHGTEKVETSFTVNASDITNQTGGAYTVHWIGTATQTTIPTGSISFSYDKEGVFSHNDYISSNGGNDLINAGLGNDTIYGNGGDDTISGGSDNDTIDGGDGNDTVLFSGNFVEYSIARDEALSRYTITDHVAGRDGTDVVTSVENFWFADGIKEDITVPTVTNFSPADSTIGVVVGSDIVVTFIEAIKRGDGFIFIHIGSADGPVVESFEAATSGNISITDKTLTINPTDDLAIDTHYFVTFDNGSFKDLTGNSYEGTTTYDFSTPNTIAPAVNVFTPADGAVGVSVASDIVLTFSEDIQLGSGAIEIHSGSETGPLVASVAEGTIASSVTGSTLILNPTDALVIGTHYFVTLDNGSVTDLAGNSYAGTTSYDFTTALFNFSFGGYNFPTVKSGFLGVGDPLNPDRAGCYWDRYELTGVENGTTVALYMGDSWVDDYLMIERNGSIIARNDDGGDGERSFDAFLVWSYMAGDVIRATTYSAGDSGSYNLYLSVSDIYEGINAVPTLSTFDSVLSETNDRTALAITLEDLKAHGDEADADGTVDSFVVKAITTGSLRIGFNAAMATPYSALNNYIIDATHQAYWSPSVGSSGTINAFTVVARDNHGAESATPVQTSVTVHAVPTLTELTGGFGTTSEDSGELVEVTYASLQEQGNEADVDGTVEAFVVKSISGTLRIGADAASATAWDALTNNTIDSTHQAYWTPAANANGTLNAFAVVAEDNSGGKSIVPVSVTIDVVPVNDPPAIDAWSNDTAWECTSWNYTITLGDPDPDTYHVTVNWGDGTALQIIDTTQHILNLSHTFSDNGYYTITVTADDQQSQANSVETDSFLATVNNVAPTVVVTGADRLNTGLSYTLSVGPVVDPGPDTQTGYSVDWGDGTTLAFTPADWEVIAKTFTHTFTANSAAETVRTITVNASDEDGIFVMGSKVVTVNRAPNDIYLDNARIAENSLAGTIIGTLYSADDEGWWSHDYQLLDDAGGRFMLVGNQIYLAAVTVLDFETATSHTIRVSSTDQGGLSFEKEIPISLTDVGPDLFISEIDTPQGVVDVDAGSSIEVFWTLATQGSEASNATWYDRIYLDNPDTPWLDRWIGDYQVSAHLPLSDGLDRIQTVQVPLDMQGTFRVVVLADAGNSVNEGTTGETNNTTYGSVLFNVLNTNLQVESVTVPASGFAGREIEVQWVVKNLGNASTPIPWWYDQLYLSSDTTLDSQDIALGVVQNASYLDIGQGYTNKGKVTLPSGLEGNYHILVKTDAYQHIQEGAGEGDNVTASTVLDIQPIPLSELSDPAVVSVAAPSQALSGQSMVLTYTIDNAGQADIAKNSPVWVERIYMSSDNILDGGDRLLDTQWRDFVADALPLPDGQSHFTATEKVILPVGVEGNFYFFVTVNPVGPVSNAFTFNDVAFDPTPTLVRLTPPPDLKVSDISASSPAVAGHDLTITYRVTNSGSTTTPNSGWYDSLYLSSDTALDSADIKLANLWHSGSLEPASTTDELPLSEAILRSNSGLASGYYTNSVTVRLANGLQGSWYLFASTDTNNDVFELDNANNIAAIAEAITIDSRPADLVVTEVTAPTAVQAGNSLRLSWTVKNQGIGDSGITQWTDRVVLSRDAVFGNSDDLTLGNFTHTGLLNNGQSYSSNELVVLPKEFSGPYQLFMETDAFNQVYEFDHENNNTRLMGVSVEGQPAPVIQIQVQIPADLRVTSLTAPASAASGDWFTVDYTVANTGVGRTNVDSWRDEVILSKDETLGNADDVNLGSVYHSNRLAPNESYQGSGSFKLPIDLQGDYHVLVRTDAGAQVNEQEGENNNQSIAAGTTTINLSPTPDLLISTLQARDQGISGQSLQVDWTVHNNGAETSGGWRQVFYLSRDGVLDRGSDIYLGYADSQMPLAAEGDATHSQSFKIPYGISGKYYLFAVVDSNNAIFERGGEGNNSTLNATPIQITPVTPVDLVAGVITVPVNAIPGALASIDYTVTNQSEQAVTGQWSDSIYLSRDAVWDVGDALFTKVGISGGLDGNESYTQTAVGTMPGLIGGDYYVIVRSDIFNQINETNEANNLNASIDTTRMDVEALTLGTLDADSFAQGGAVYYRVDVAAGETLRFNFDRAATEGRTELFISYDAMPSRSDFDYRYNQADSPDQSIVIANTRGGTYYVMAYNASGATDTYSITAESLHFSITDLGVNAGSNKGQVTILINGAEFTSHTVAKLVSQNGMEYAASQVLWKDGTEIWATFDLRDLNTGDYDVKLEDGSRVALLNDGFTVNTGELGHIDYGIETPPALRPGQTGSVRVYYQNTGETDVRVPLLTVSGNALLKLPGDVDFGGNSMSLLGINQEGEAGILSPGAEGSFQLVIKPDFQGAGNVNLTISSAPMDWTALLESAKPDIINLTAWEQIANNLVRQMGASTDYHAALAQNATALAQLEDRTNNISRLFNMEFNQATNGGVLLHSFATGSLGVGRIFQWDITAKLQNNGDVIVNIGDIEERFTHQPNGSYQGIGDATLIENGGVFTWQQQDGKKIVFNLDGRFDTLQNNNGQIWKANYSEHHLSQIIGSNGDTQSFIYNDQGRLTQVTHSDSISTFFSYDDKSEYLTSLSTKDGTIYYDYVTEQGAAEHQLSSVTMLNGTVVHFEYDDHGRLTKESLNDGSEAILFRYVGINKVDVSDTSGITTNLFLDEQGKIAQVEDSSGHITQLHYGIDNKLSGVVNDDGTIHLFSIDASGKPLSFEVQEALGTTARFGFYGDGQLSSLLLYDNNPINVDAAGVSFMRHLVALTEADVAKATDLVEPVVQPTVVSSGSEHPIMQMSALGSFDTVMPASSTTTTVLDFSAIDRNMWGTGSAVNLDVTWDDLLLSKNLTKSFSEYGFSGIAELNANVGLVAKLVASTGDVDLNYQIAVDANKPDIVKSGNSFIFDTSSWSLKNGLLESMGPDIASSKFTLDFLFNVSGGLHDLQYDPPLLEPINFDPLVVEPIKLDKNIVTIGTGNPTYELSGSYGSLSFGIPGPVQTSSGIKSSYNSLIPLVSYGISSTPLGNLNVDLDALAHALFPAAVPALDYSFSRGDFKLDFNLLDVDANLNANVVQKFTFTPTDIRIDLTSSYNGEHYSGHLGDTFSFTTPSEDSGYLTINATYTIDGILRNQTGLALSASLDAKALDLTIDGKLVGDWGFDWSPFGGPLLKGSFPEGGLPIGDPLYLYDQSFNWTGFDSKKSSYIVYYSNTYEPKSDGGDPYDPPTDSSTPPTVPPIPVIAPRDPNDIVGPQGFGDDHWTTSQNALPYTIHYENQATATAPAQEVTITQTLDSDLNASSFRLGDFGWSDIYIDVPDGTSFHIDRIDLTASKGYMVDVMAGIDVAKHEAYWSFTTIDPTTGEIPVDPTIGFLPANVTKGTGEGFVNYTVRANADAPTGTVIDAKATIVFTTQEPIDTPAISNTLDTQAPESKVEAMASATVESAQFLVRWSGSDVGSAIAGYTVYVADDGGTYTPWLENTTLTEATYAGQPGHTYAFYTVATDNAGNKEAAPDQVDLTIHVTEAAALSDTVSPEIKAILLPTDGLYAAGQSLDFAAKFTETMFVDVAGQPPVINFTVGSSEVEAVYQSGSGTDTLIFSHLVAAGEYDADGMSLGSALQTNGATLRDVAGNPLVGLGLIAGSTSGILIDNTPVLQSALADQSVTEGQNFSFQVPGNTFADVDAGDTLGYTATLVNGDALPAWLSFDNTTRSFSGIPWHGVPNTLSVKVTATDSSLASVSDSFDLMVANLNQVTGSATFWKTDALISGVTSTLASRPAATGTQLVEFRNIELLANGSRTIEIWETSAKSDINSLELKLALSSGSVATWQDAAGLPSGWTSMANTEKPGLFILGGIGLTALSTGLVKLGTLTLTAPTNPQHFELSLSSGLLGKDIVPAFGIASDSMTTGSDGLYQHTDMADGIYTLTSAKVSGASEANAIHANDALAALKMAVAMNPNTDGSEISPYQYLAADINKDGVVKAADALNILKMAVKLSSAPEMEWLFMPESVGSETMSRTHVIWPDNPIPVTLDNDLDLHLIGIVKGDVDGSWVA
ncbi:MAG: CARDB domain-containing protein [Chlorobium sp.]